MNEVAILTTVAMMLTVPALVAGLTAVGLRGLNALGARYQSISGGGPVGDQA